MNKALFEKATGLVVNIIRLEDGAAWQLPDGHDVVDAGTARIGDTWDGNIFIPGVKPALVEDADVVAIRDALPNWATMTAAQKLEVVKAGLNLTLKRG